MLLYCNTTVLGPIDDPQSLGVVLPHEQLLLDLSFLFKEPEYGVEKDIADLTFELKNLGKIRHFPYVRYIANTYDFR